MTHPNKPDPVCAACSKRIGSGSLCLFQHGDLYHVRCSSAALGLLVAEEHARAGDAKTRAAEVVARSAKLIEEAKRRRATPDISR